MDFDFVNDLSEFLEGNCENILDSSLDLSPEFLNGKTIASDKMKNFKRISLILQTKTWRCLLKMKMKKQKLAV